MAKGPQQFYYTFRLKTGTHIEVVKSTPDGDHVVTYNVKGNLLGQCFCDCPASWHAKRHGKPDKHVGMVHRYLALMEKLGDTVQAGDFVYLDTVDNKFYLNRSLRGDDPWEIPT